MTAIRIASENRMHSKRPASAASSREDAWHSLGPLLKNSHVIPALIRKCHEAKVGDAAMVDVWGIGSPLREFLCRDDMARACVSLMSDIENVSRLFASGWKPEIDLERGIGLAYTDLCERFGSA